MLPEIECERCHLRWVPRGFPRPKKCPRCHAPYQGPVVIGLTIPYEADQFFQKIGFDYEYVLKDALIAHLDGWQLDTIEKGNVDEALFQESVKIFEILGCPELSIKREVLEKQGVIE